MVKLVENKINKNCLKMVALGSGFWNIIKGGSGSRFYYLKTGPFVHY
jgi:hypothetical protein